MTAEAATGDLGDFRERTRNWLEANCPAGMRTPAGEKDIVWGGRNAQYPSEDARAWLERMAERGWTAPTWPTAYGGGGLTAAHARVLDEELKRIGARAPLLSFGVWMLGPVLLEYATEEQKLRHLPPIVRGEIRWCQGYSEPGAGSDLAALQTRAEEDGDGFVVNGQKVWTSYADQADWIFCLVRTDSSSKHEGISFLLIDMASPGVEVRPIRLISGASPFCETFFTDVRVPAENLVGRVGGGWEIAKRLPSVRAPEHLGRRLRPLPGPGAGRRRQDLWRATASASRTPDLRARIAAWRMDAEAVALTVRRVEAEARAGAGVGPRRLDPEVRRGQAEPGSARTDGRDHGNAGAGLARERRRRRFFGRGARRHAPMAAVQGQQHRRRHQRDQPNVVAKRVLGLLDHQ
jgi:alkylation response protein AidB-like acyl-CoA dehydrogenase